MRITIELDGLEEPAVIARLTDSVEKLYQIQRFRAEPIVTFTRDELAADDALPPLAAGTGGTSDAIKAAAVAFGKQPLPVEAENYLGMPGAPSLPLAPAPSPAAANPSTTAPAAPPASSTVVPVPPAPVVASTPAPPVVSPAPAAIVDKNGLPWDERIHASSRAINADGTWRAKRGVQGTLVTQVEAELRGQATPPAEPIAAAPNAPTPPVPAAPVAPAAPTGEQLTFQAAVARIGPKMRDGTISPERFLEVVAPFGLAGLHQLNNQPHETLLEICTQLGV